MSHDLRNAVVCLSVCSLWWPLIASHSLVITSQTHTTDVVCVTVLCQQMTWYKPLSLLNTHTERERRWCWIIQMQKENLLLYKQTNKTGGLLSVKLNQTWSVARFFLLRLWVVLSSTFTKPHSEKLSCHCQLFMSLSTTRMFVPRLHINQQNTLTDRREPYSSAPWISVFLSKPQNRAYILPHDVIRHF